MIDLIIKDGLGNQMFQYAFARLLAEKHKQRGEREGIRIIMQFINSRQDEGNEVRRMSLQHFVLGEDVAVMPEQEQKSAMKRFKWRTLWTSGLWELIKWRLSRRYESTDALAARRGKHGIYYPYGPYTDHPLTLSKCDEKFVFGFFQSIQNVAPIRDILLKELKVKTEPSEANRSMLQAIASKNAVCLHIRRGDFLNPRWKNLQICDYDYYSKAIDIMLEKTENPVFYIFSNTSEDLKWIAQNYRFPQKYPGTEQPIEINYVDLNNPDYEELRLMYTCKHFIISNSTFSWWAAWLSENKDKIVCAPERWNLEYEDDYKIYDPSWIKVPR